MSEMLITSFLKDMKDVLKNLIRNTYSSSLELYNVLVHLDLGMNVGKSYFYEVV